MWSVLLLFVGLPLSSYGNLRQLKLIDDWKTIDFIFPNDHQRNNAILTKEFVPGQAVPIDVDVYYKGS